MSNQQQQASARTVDQHHVAAVGLHRLIELVAADPCLHCHPLVCQNLRVLNLSTTPSAVVMIGSEIDPEILVRIVSECRQRHSSCCRRNVQTLTCLRAPSGAKPRHYSIGCCMIGSEIDPEILVRIVSECRQRHSSCCRRNVQTLTCLRAPSGAKPQHYSIGCCMIGSEIDPEILVRIVSECRQRHSSCCRRNVQTLTCLRALSGAKPRHYSIGCCMIGSEIDPEILVRIVSECRQRHSSCCRRNVQTLTCLRAPSGAKPRHYSIGCCMIGSEIDPEILVRIVSECRQRHSSCCRRNVQILTCLRAPSGAKPQHYSIGCCMIGSEIDPEILVRIVSECRQRHSFLLTGRNVLGH